jgi:hypothetical protein
MEWGKIGLIFWPLKMGEKGRKRPNLLTSSGGGNEDIFHKFFTYTEHCTSKVLPDILAGFSVKSWRKKPQLFTHKMSV